MFTICRSLGEIRGQISINNTLLSEQLGGDTLVSSSAAGQEDPWQCTAVCGCISQIFVSFYLVPTPGNTCDVETVEQMIFP